MLRVRADEPLGELVEDAVAARRCACARVQSCPALAKTPDSAPIAPPASRSASAKTMLADLPPSSSETRLMLSAASAHDLAPDLGRAGEGDLVDARDARQRRAGDRAAAR